MLLSFAQFEREITGERIRDKIAASKRKGLWMGGVVPLGYEVQDRQLIVNRKDAGTAPYLRAISGARQRPSVDARTGSTAYSRNVPDIPEYVPVYSEIALRG